jgi:sodium/potassium-transporting ATPase subunit alpha
MYILSVLLAYVEPINTVFSTRDLIFEHYIMPAVPFSILMLIYDEFRKYLIRNFKQYDKSKPNWFARNCLC